MKFGRRDDLDEEGVPDALDEASSVSWLKRATLAVVFIVILAVAGVGWFMYDNGFVQVADQQIPLIRADEGETKVRPEDPGGLEIPHQDKLVFERLAPDQSEPLVERLLPPPELPIERPTLPDLPVASVEQPAGESPSDAPQPPPPPVEVETAEAAPDDPAAPVEELVIEPTEPEAVETAEATPVEETTAAEPAEVAAAPATPPAEDQIAQVIESLADEEPAPEPEEQLATLPASPESPAAPSSDARDGWRIQVASLRDQTSAEGEWIRLKERHADVLTGLSLNLQRADLDRGTFYRIQAGPLPDRGSAEQACDRLKSRSQGCLVVSP